MMVSPPAPAGSRAWLARGLPAVAAIATVAAAGAPSPAAADELFATRNQPLDEVSHTVAVRISDGVATYTVQRQFQNRGRVAEEARLAITLPTGAAATGLRIRAGAKWHTGELLDRDVAAERYRELTGAGVYDPRDPALLYWLSSSELFLQVFPVLPGTTNTVEYTLTVPTRYAGGRYWLTYPRVDPATTPSPARARSRTLVHPVVTVHPTWAPAAGGVVIDGRPAEPGKPIALGPQARAPWQRPAPAPAPAPAGNDADADLAAAGDDVPYTASAIEIPASREAELRHTLAKIRVELQHAALTDLRLTLVTPAGELVEVADGANDTLDARAAFTARLPRPTRAAGRWRLLVRSNATDAGALLGWSISFSDRTTASADTPVFIPGSSDLPGTAVVAIAPPPATVWTGRLGRVVASSAHAFTRLELDAAPRLSAVPRRAQVVFVLDASHSAAELLGAQLAIVRAYLAHVPDAELELVAVRRTARRVFGRFVPAADAPRALEAAVRSGALAPGNGSALDEGAKLATTLLAGRAGPQRVVLATDELLRSSLTDADALASLSALDPAAVVHVVVPSADDSHASAGAPTDPTDPAGPAGPISLPSLARDDAGPLAALASAHHGILARISGVPAKGRAREPDLEPAVLELVRPTRIDQLALTDPAAARSLSVADTLREGEGLRLFEAGLTAAAAPQSLSLTGKLWSDPIRIDLATTPSFSTASAAFVFGADQHGHLDPAEQRTVALAARAVSPVTSYLAIEPGVRPSKIGLDDEEGTFGWGTIGSGRYGTLSRCGGASVSMSVDLAPLIPTAACVRKHAAGRPWAVKLELETTKDEIVDVKIQNGADPLAACLAEAAWSVRLPPSFTLGQNHHTVDLFGP